MHTIPDIKRELNDSQAKYTPKQEEIALEEVHKAACKKIRLDSHIDKMAMFQRNMKQYGSQV